MKTNPHPDATHLLNEDFSSLPSVWKQDMADNIAGIRAAQQRIKQSGRALGAGLFDPSDQTEIASHIGDAVQRGQRMGEAMETVFSQMQQRVVADVQTAVSRQQALRRFQTQQARAHYDATYGQQAAPTTQRAQTQETPADVIDIQAKPVAGPPA